MINKFITASVFALVACASVHATHQEESASSYDARQFALVPTTSLTYARSLELGVGSGGGDPKPFKIVYPSRSVLSLERDMRQTRFFGQFPKWKMRNWNPQQESLAQRALSVLLKPVIEAGDDCKTLPHVLAGTFANELKHGSECATILLYLPSQDLTPSLETNLAKALESRIELLEMLESRSSVRLLNLLQLDTHLDASLHLTSLTPLIPLTPLTEGGLALPPLTLTPLAADLSHLYIKEEEAASQGDA